VLAVSRKRCVFHVDGVCTSTRGKGAPANVDACGQGGKGVNNLIFCGRHKWMALSGNAHFSFDRRQ